MSVFIHDIAIIGSGNVANFIAHILSEKGFNISQVHSRNSITGKNLASKIKSEFIEEITAVTAEIIFIAVHDQQIEKSIAKLPKSSILFYTSGTVDLASISAENCGVFYPLQTFSKSNYNAPFDGPILLESKNDLVRDYALMLCSELKLNYQITSSEERKNIHLCAVFLNNFINHIACIGLDLAKERKIDISLFTPLIKKTFENILLHNPSENQSGPAKRNDKTIINEHLALLNGNSKTIYHLITESILAQNGYEL